MISRRTHMLLVFAILSAVNAQKPKACPGVNNPAKVGDVTAQTKQDKGLNNVLVLPDMALNCYGVVSKWEFHCLADGTILFQMWRPTGTAGQFQYLGGNEFVATGCPGVKSYDVPEYLQIPVRAGDVAGFAQKDGNGVISMEYYSSGSTSGQELWTSASSYAEGQNKMFAGPKRRGVALMVYAMRGQRPEFDNVPGEVEIPENAPLGTFVFYPRVSDKNVRSTWGDIVTINFTDPTHTMPFRLTSKDRIKLNGPLDFETTPQYVISLTASDPAIINVKSLTVNVIDVNEPHVITNLPADVTVDAQNTPKDTTIYKIEVVDPEGAVTVLNHYLQTANPSDGTWYIDKVTGEVKSNIDLKTVTVTEYTLSIIVSDDNNLAGPAELKVKITNLRRPPVFINLPGVAQVDEDAIKSTKIFQVQATDPDGDKPFTYKVVSVSPSSGASKFTLNEKDGGIAFVDNPGFDWETINRYTITLTVSDSMHTSDPGELVIDVKNVNDPPVWSPDSYSCVIKEKQKVNYQLPVTLVVEDPEGKDLSFSISPSEGSSNFQVDAKGITLKKVIDLKDQPDTTYTLEIIATDPEGAASKASVEVRVEQINDPHSITNLPESIAVSAQVFPVGSQVFKVTASTEPGDVIVFQAASLSPSDGTFTINSTSGAVLVANDLSLAQVKYEMKIVATDPQIAYTAGPLTLTINVEGINKPPEIINLPATVDVEETETKKRALFTIKATDPDNDDVTFELISIKPNSGSLKFQFLDTGIVNLFDNPFLDSTKENKYELTVIARDKFDHVSGKEVLTINVKEVNQPPILNPKTYSTTIEEKLKIGSAIGVTLLATDPDPNDVIVFSLGDTAGSNNFKITGSDVQIAKQIDVGKSESETFTMKVIATDQKGLTDVGSLTVTVTNVNDPHTMPDLPASTDVNAKTTKKNQIIYTVNVDKEDIDILSYRMTSDPDDGLFTMDPITGAIRATKDLSTWKGAALHDLSITTSDGKFSIGPENLQINLKNLNQPPTIKNLPQTIEIKENTIGDAWLFKILAEDSDNDPVTYTEVSLEPPTTDIIFDTKDGVAKIIKNPAIDFETASQYVLTVTASDGLWTTEPVSLTVNVLNVNEVPLFSPDKYTVTVPEEQKIGSVVPVDLQYSDPDANDVVQLSIADGKDSSLFKIDNGKIAVAKRIDLDAGQASMVTLQVVAKDRAGLTGAATITITIDNVNEQHSILNLPSDLSLSAQKVKANEKVFTVDVGLKEPMDVYTYSMTSVPDTKIFAINKNGEIICTEALQNSSVSGYRLSVTVQDRSSVYDAGPAELTVTVTDLKQPPVWENLPSAVTLQENTARRTGIFGVRATDPDKDTISYKLVDVSPSSGQSKFVINATTGKVNTVAGSLFDFEGTEKEFILYVSAADYLFSANTSTLRVEVLDVNERPGFEPKTYTVTVPEEQPKGSIILQVNALDVDAKDKLSYSVLDGAGSQYFQMDGNKLVILTKIDFDSGINPAIHLGIIVSDKAGLTDRADVYVTLQDINDNKPVFSQPIYKGNVSENTFGGFFVLTVTATDKDSGENGRITYSIIEANAASYFQVDPDTGVVRVKQQIDYEKIQSMKFRVLAEDNGTPQKSATANVEITISDINDNRPTFLREFYNSEVPSDRAIGSQIVQLQAVDRDSKITNSLHYHLLIHNAYFTLGESSGQVSVGTALQTDVKYVLYSYAKDDGHPAEISNIAFVRIDSFDEWKYLVDMELNIDASDFTPKKQQDFLSAVGNVLSPWVVKIDKFVAQTDEGKGFTYRRRLLATGTKTLVTLYALKDNTTDSVTNVEKPKVFIHRDDILSETRKDLSGNPQAVLTTDAFADFLVTRVSPTMQVWLLDTVEGVVTLSFIVILSILLLFALALSIFCCWRKELLCFGRRRSRSETDLSNYKKQQQRKSVTHDSNINKITPVEQPEKAGQNDFFMLRYWKPEDRNTEKNEFPANNKNNNNVTTQMRVPPPSIVVPAPSPRNNEVQDRFNKRARSPLPRPTMTEPLNVHSARRPPAAKPGSGRN